MLYRWIIGGGLLLALLLGGLYLIDRGKAAPPVDGSLTVAEAMANADTVGYDRAIRPRDFVFPADHGPHPGFKTEWWYYTGNLQGRDGRPFGFQFTLFRTALVPPDRWTDRDSPWATHQLYMGHFAVSDIAGRRFHAAERFSRGDARLAGAQAEPFRVWLEDWVTDAPDHAPGDPFPPFRIVAGDGPVHLELMVTHGKPPVLQGDRGLSQKGDGTGNASYYYSLTRLAASGRMMAWGDTVPVTGSAWMDREWSTSALGENQVGWDWFALQLADGRELMYYQLRRDDGSPDPLSKGAWVETDASYRRIGSDEVDLTVTDYWDSPRGGRYPAGWELALPGENLRLTVMPRLADQELPVSIRYWEGSVAVSGTSRGEPVSGVGYVELTGYADRPLPE